MTATTMTATTPQRAGARSREQRPSLARLTDVELRKAVDTRAGIWLLLGIGALTLCVVVLTAILGDAHARGLPNMLSNATTPVVLLLPIVGILLVTAEWSQRTGLVTFALAPARGRVLAAKLLAAAALAIVGFAVAVVAAVIASAVAGGSLHAAGGLYGQAALYVVVETIQGVAFGALLLLPAPAIVAELALPIALTALGSIHALAGAAEWLDPGKTLDPLTSHLLSGTDWAQLAATSVLWILVPLTLGVARILRGEIR